MLSIVGDPVDPRRLAYSSLPQYENVDILLQLLQIQQQEVKIGRRISSTILA